MKPRPPGTAQAPKTINPPTDWVGESKETPLPGAGPQAEGAGGQPDLADLIYGVHRCCHGHGDDLPDGFELLSRCRRAAGPNPCRGHIRRRPGLATGSSSDSSLSPSPHPPTPTSGWPEGYHVTYSDTVRRRPGRGAAPHPGHGDGVDRAVQGPVTAAVEPMPHRLAAAGLQWAGPRQRGERGVAAAAPGVGERHDRLGRGDRAETATAGQPGSDLVHDGLQLGPGWPRALDARRARQGPDAGSRRAVPPAPSWTPAVPAAVQPPPAQDR